MATQILRTNRRSYNHNPQGSSTAVVTTAADNPFERRVSLRTTSMLPGLGSLGVDEPAPAAAPATSPWLSLLQTGLTNIGLTAIAANVLPSPHSQPLSAQGVQQLHAAGAINLTTPSTSPVPPANTVAYPIRDTMVPHPGGIMSMLPWIVGGVAILSVGGLVLFKKKK